MCCASIHEAMRAIARCASFVAIAGGREFSGSQHSAAWPCGRGSTTEDGLHGLSHACLCHLPSLAATVGCIPRLQSTLATICSFCRLQRCAGTLLCCWREGPRAQSLGAQPRLPFLSRQSCSARSLPSLLCCLLCSTSPRLTILSTTRSPRPPLPPSRTPVRVCSSGHVVAWRSSGPCDGC